MLLAMQVFTAIFLRKISVIIGYGGRAIFSVVDVQLTMKMAK